MVSPDKSKKTKDVEYANLTRNRGSRKKRKPSNVLKSKRFVLCFKNLTLQTKCENQIKNLGAIIVPYIDKEVNYVVTDIPGYNGKATSLAETTSIISPQCYSVSPATSVSGDDPTATKKSRTRTEAMLEKVSVQTPSVSSIKNPITSALSWKIPVYSLDFFQSILKKKLNQIQFTNERNDETKNDKNVRVFRKRYLKLEHAADHRYRPEFKEPSRWPSIDVNSAAGSCPFDTKSSRRSTRKHGQKKDGDRMNRTYAKSANEAGYCEICAIHYDDLSQHVTTSAHLKIVCDDKHFVDLDNCIKTRSVEAFLASHNSSDNNSRMKEVNANEDMGRNLRKSVSLHLNNNNENSSVTRSLSNAKLLADESLKQPLQVQCNGFTNYHLRKSTIKSDSVLMKSPSVFSGNNKDLLRETRKIYSSCPEGNNRTSHNQKDLSQLSPIEEVDGSHRLRSRKNLLLPATLLGTTAEDTNKNRNQLLSPLTPTSNHFLRSSSSPKSLPGGRNASKANHDEDDKKSPPSLKQNCASGSLPGRRVYKMNCVSPCENEGTKRISRSLTSPREETRMNGKPSSLRRKCSVATSDDEEKCAGVSVSPRSNVPSYPCNRSHLYNDSMTEQNGNGRKRMSLEEKFLEDNKEYYKVELLRTKLRSTEFYCNKEIDQSGAGTTRRDESKFEQNRKQLLHQASLSQQYAVTDSDEHRKMGSRSRQSALHLLNLEATNFMFGPPKKDDSSDDSTNDESSGDATSEKESSPLKPMGRIHDRTKVSSPSNNIVHSKRIAHGKEKRRTHAEVFIHDNLDYYKFEISGSRLRHNKKSGSSSSHKRSQAKTSEVASTSTTPSEEAPPEVKSEIVEVKQEIVEPKEEFVAEPVSARKRGRTKKNISSPSPSEDIPFADCETPQPCEIKIESDTDLADDGCYERPAPPSDSVRFGFEAVPHYEPWFKAFQRFDLCDERFIPIPRSVYFTRYRYVTPLPYARRRDPDKSSGTVAVASPSSKDNGILAHFRRRRRPRLGRFVVDDKPRKSPRCHASTLAILSSLTGNRRRSRKLLASLELSAAKPSNGPRPTGPRPTLKTFLEHNKTINEISQEYQKKLKEAVKGVAKDIDDHFIDVFKSDDCEDAYLKRISKTVEPVVDSMKNGDIEEESWQCCLHIDDEIFRDEDLLRSLMTECPNTFDNMSSFLASSEGCTSMETAQDEDMMMPRSNDILARLCRENDLSCNSSDCGASSTCEFLGFAEDGRTVSRKRKRKRPNMTGWPDDRNKRRQLRMLRARQNGCSDMKNDENDVTSVTESVENKASEPPSVNVSATVSEADSECTDDDIPLQELAGVRKRRRTNNSLSAANDALEMSKKNEEVTMNGDREPTLSRRASKAAGTSHTTPSRKLMPVTRRKSSASQTSRRNRCI